MAPLSLRSQTAVTILTHAHFVAEFCRWVLRGFLPAVARLYYSWQPALSIGNGHNSRPSLHLSQRRSSIAQRSSSLSHSIAPFATTAMTRRLAWLSTPSVPMTWTHTLMFGKKWCESWPRGRCPQSVSCVLTKRHMTPSSPRSKQRWTARLPRVPIPAEPLPCDALTARNTRMPFPISWRWTSMPWRCCRRTKLIMASTVHPSAICPRHCSTATSRRRRRSADWQSAGRRILQTAKPSGLSRI